MRRWETVLAAALIGAAALVGAGGQGRAADHRDAPSISEDPRADLGDVFSFVNPKNGNLVLAMTVNPFTVPQAIGVAFSPNVLYQFKIDNTGDAVEDLVIQARFSPQPFPFQTVTVTEPFAPLETGPVMNRPGVKGLPNELAPAVSGPADGTVFTGTGAIRRVFAGLRDDPFFVDLPWWTTALHLLPIPPPARPPGVETHAGLNVTALVVEVTPAALRGSTGNVIRVWATTSRPAATTRTPDREEVNAAPFVQVDRTATPALSPLLQDFKLLDQFNRTAPADDRRLYHDVVTATLTRINGDPVLSGQIADTMLPDVQTLDLTSPRGFPNGRRPADDFIDYQLNVWTKGALKSDHVDANDVPFLVDFPFLAPPHPPEEPTRERP